ncbi:SPbeta prophage-derived putative protein YoqB [Bacillus subtilis]|uniref:hypothetical protein n=1 Tax=Bacillus TaxID=1386 RepID=UPI00034B7DD9|nr:hypothetical protein [Bacillus]KAA0936959.1 hypothetical protein FQ086_05110 [Bacillus sp. ANT_WA51]KFC32341.1 hypothetical protein ZQL_05235 [Bacillus subtilis]MCG3227871.1 hypothetical protein [Bacillus subtilis]MCM3008446.1 hypothetical protein [Bacillus subtilis]MCY8985899.1 hypothetical protein [Bacillus subtilis]
MKEFHLHKYPVTSVEGNEYAVSIYNDRHSKGFVKVSLYKKVRGFFRKEKFKCLTREGDFAPSYFEEKWDYDYIQMAINEVIIYENSIKEKINHENKQKAAIEKFEAWNGQEV